jgi:hypothetical protein
MAVREGYVQLLEVAAAAVTAVSVCSFVAYRLPGARRHFVKYLTHRKVFQKAYDLYFTSCTNIFEEIGKFGFSFM